MRKSQLKKCVADAGGVKVFAELINVTPAAVYHYLSGYRRPKPEVALKIEQATGGRVTKESLIWRPEIRA